MCNLQLIFLSDRKVRREIAAIERTGYWRIRSLHSQSAYNVVAGPGRVPRRLCTFEHAKESPLAVDWSTPARKKLRFAVERSEREYMLLS